MIRHATLPRILATLFSRLGDGWVYFAIIIAIAARQLQPDPEIHALVLALCLALSTAFMLTIKPIVKRARPIIRRTLLRADYYSFPSGHTMTAFAFAICCGEFYLGFLFPLLAFAACVGVSRVILGAHYWSDILIAALWGMLLGYGCAEVTMHWMVVRTSIALGLA